jgi:Protein of unknown function (DUF2934)
VLHEGTKCPRKILNFFISPTQNVKNFFYNSFQARCVVFARSGVRIFFSNRSIGSMASKTPGTPRKAASSRKTTERAKQATPVTPIRESNGASAENGGAQLHPGIQEEIRTRAYELYVERGGQDGFDQEDWARAEREILAKYQKESA